VCPHIQVCSTDADVIERAHLLMGCVSVIHPRPLPSGKTAYSIQLHGHRAVKIMEQLLPYMGQRRSRKIQDIVAANKLRPGSPKGELHGQAKLTNQQAAAARADYKTDHGRGAQVRLARKYGVDHTTMWYVLKGRTYRDATLTKL
jgi:hypothetical protein